ncbi:STAS domain-containing protein [Nonomuraea diastatica]|uniref:Anti-sigma factor antagonist n=1 Tax=Nonomuraea diastatica TaxID=1848329 RepID=A0A4R4W306_9ACTN|nr:STAS domain-containing protein [Nonomuraea diastatica]TDD12959.1 anti-sigma factor antagonist [Nonomuraea diastatica]
MIVVTLSAHMTQRRNGLVLVLKGELDFSTTPRLLEAVSDALTGGTANLLIDAGGLTFCDSHGLEGLLEAQKRINRAGGSMELAHVHGRVRRVLDLSGLGRAFTIV